ncbi:hypothetical protein MIDIC_420005 [Alphaproteobacteria bacterium]
MIFFILSHNASTFDTTGHSGLSEGAGMLSKTDTESRIMIEIVQIYGS